MTWLAPWALAAGALGMLGVVAAHLLTRQRPRALVLATARFLPAGMLEATTLQRVPMDRWWMLLRLLILALLAAGAAQPVVTGSRVPSRTALLLDRSLPVDAQRRALSTLASTDVVIAYDSIAVLVGPDVRPVEAGGASLSSAFGRLVRVRDSLAAGARRLHVAIASEFRPGSLDPATEHLRMLVADSIIVMPVVVAPETARIRGPVTVHADGNDPIAATALLLGDSVALASAIIERGASLTRDDSSAANAGATVFWWPARVAKGEPKLQALTVGTHTWIAPMERDAASAAGTGHAIGWWADGTIAVRETRIGNGCLLRLGASLPGAGDHTLSLSAQAWLAAVLTACDREPHVAAPAPAWLAPPPASTTSVSERSVLVSSSAPWLIATALCLAAAELLLRWRRRA